jgi:hypothetical protein
MNPGPTTPHYPRQARCCESQDDNRIFHYADGMVSVFEVTPLVSTAAPPGTTSAKLPSEHSPERKRPRSCAGRLTVRGTAYGRLFLYR